MNLVSGVSTSQKFGRDGPTISRRGISRNASPVVEGRADADMLHPDALGHVVDVIDEPLVDAHGWTRARLSRNTCWASSFSVL